MGVAVDARAEGEDLHGMEVVHQFSRQTVQKLIGDADHVYRFSRPGGATEFSGAAKVCPMDSTGIISKSVHGDETGWHGASR